MTGVRSFDVVQTGVMERHGRRGYVTDTQIPTANTRSSYNRASNVIMFPAARPTVNLMAMVA